MPRYVATRLGLAAALAAGLAAGAGAQQDYPAAPLPPPVYPAPTAVPPQRSAPIDQQKEQAYRNELLSRQRELQNQNVPVTVDRFRETQGEINRIGPAPR